MSFVLLGLLLIVGMTTLVVMVLRGLGLRLPTRPPGWALLSLFAAATLLLLGRPDEQIEAGEDPGVYFNVAHDLVAYDAFSFADPALSRLSPEQRLLFRYGHPAFRITKDAVLWARDPSLDRVGVFFAPAYSILLAVPVGLGFSCGVFALTSLNAVACGLILAGLSKRLSANPAAPWCAYALFLLHPAVAWNARALRAEWPAALLALAGLSLWLLHLTRATPSSWRQGLAAGLALGAAPLFHMTAIYVLTPALFLAVLLSRREPFWWAWWLGVFVGILMLILQTVYVADPYFLRITLADPRRAPLIGMLALAVPAVAGVLRTLLGRLRLGEGFWTVAARSAAITLLLVAFLWGARDDHGRVPGLPSWTAAYLSLTDFRGVARLLTPFVLVAALLGFFPLVHRGGFGRGLFALLAPAAFAIGWVVNYMFETRRMVAFLAPLLILSLVSLFDALVRRLPRAARTPAMAALSAVPLALWLTSHWPIYRIWNLRGTCAFYQHVAQRLAGTTDLLLGEYTQSIAPVARLAKLPFLSVAWDHRTDREVAQASEVFSELVQFDPAQRLVLLSPFRGAIVPGVGWEPLFTETLRTKRLDRARREVPHGIGRRERQLHAVRLWSSASSVPAAPYVREFPGSRLGLHNAGESAGARRSTHRGVELRHPLRLETGSPTPSRLWAFLATPYGPPPDRVEITGHDTLTLPLGGRWTLLDISGVADAIELPAIPGTFLSQLFVSADDSVTEIPLPPDRGEFGLDGQESQWMRDGTSLALPLPPGGGWIWVRVSRGHDNPTSSFTWRDSSDRHLATLEVPDAWTWVPLRLAPEPARRGLAEWVTLRSDTPSTFRLSRLCLVPDRP